MRRFENHTIGNGALLTPDGVLVNKLLKRRLYVGDLMEGQWAIWRKLALAS